VYLSQTLDGAIAEALGVPNLYGFDPSRRLPLTMVAIDAHLDVVIDFTDAALRKTLELTLSALTSVDWRNENAAGREAITQSLGRAAFEVGAQGIIVPSAVRRSIINLNVFPANLSGASHLSIQRARQLPRPPSRKGR